MQEGNKAILKKSKESFTQFRQLDDPGLYLFTGNVNQSTLIYTKRIDCGKIANSIEKKKERSNNQFKFLRKVKEENRK